VPLACQWSRKLVFRWSRSHVLHEPGSETDAVPAPEIVGVIPKRRDARAVASAHGPLLTVSTCIVTSEGSAQPCRLRDANSGLYWSGG
jgi:hypothetical protein